MSIAYIRPDLFAYPSRRSDVHARNVVATSQPLATQAGIDAMRRGGNAVDAALAAAICLTVVEPTGNGIGSDAFAIVSHDNVLHGYNGSGRAPAAWTRDRFAHLPAMPAVGWEAVTVPGAVDTWVALSRRFGRLAFESLFEAGVHYARNGYAVSPVIQHLWSASIERYGHLDGFRDTFMPNGAAPGVGELFTNPGAADSLEAIARTRGEAFYQGDLAAAISDDAARHDAVLTREDLANHRGAWVDPVSVGYGSLEVHELPPNGQGMAALVALGILSHLDVRRYHPDSAEATHLGIEAMKLGFADALAHVADPEHMRVSVADLLDPARLRRLADGIDPDVARLPDALPPSDHGTVYLCAADAEGTMISMIQSNFQGFGSGIVVPGTGISLHNRGAGFVLDPAHDNCVAGGRRPFHTIIPGFVTRGGRALGAIGVMGGHMQPQGHLQLVSRLEDFGQNLQAALDAPRWFVGDGLHVALEHGVCDETAEGLAARGHQVDREPPHGLFGGAQAIVATEAGYQGASDARKDGCAAGF